MDDHSRQRQQKRRTLAEATEKADILQRELACILKNNKKCSAAGTE